MAPFEWLQSFGERPHLDVVAVDIDVAAMQLPGLPGKHMSHGVAEQEPVGWQEDGCQPAERVEALGTGLNIVRIYMNILELELFDFQVKKTDCMDMPVDMHRIYAFHQPSALYLEPHLILPLHKDTHALAVGV